MSITKTYTSVITEADDGSGDLVLTFPEEILQQTGWKEGTELNLEVVDAIGGPILIITEKKNGTT